MRILVTMTFLALALNVAAVTPMDFEVPEGKITKIECECKEGTPNIEKGVFKIQKGIYHYKVYLPKGYKENKDKKYRCMFIASPGGNARMGNMEKPLKQGDWIVIMLVESKNGPDAPCNGNFIAAHDDAVKRFRIQDGMKYATGMSGGARASTQFLTFRDGFAGVILQGAGFGYDWENVDKSKRGGEHYYECLDKNKKLAVYGIFGDKDKNRGEIETMKEDLSSHRYKKFELFDGGHVWAPAECFDHALDWMDEQLASTTKSKDICLKIFKSNMASLDKIENKFLKYEKLHFLEDIAKKHSLTRDPDIKESLKDIKSELSTLEKDDDVEKEAKALKAFNSVLSKENRFREKKAKGRSSKRRLTLEIDRLIRAYERVVKSYEGTLYGEKAAKKIAQLEEEKEK